MLVVGGCREGGRGSRLKVWESGFSYIFAASTEALAYFTQILLLLSFIVCEGAYQSVQQQTPVIICILKCIGILMYVVLVQSTVLTVSFTICSGYILKFRSDGVDSSQPKTLLQ